MTKPLVKPFQAIVEKSRAAVRHFENSARLAHSFGEVTTSGWGEFAPEDRIEFEAPFLHRPSVSYGASFYESGSEDDPGLRDTRFPRCTGLVHDWDIDKNGLYRGCWVLVTVEDRSPFIEPTDPDPDPTYHILHDFTFLGTAMKDIPLALNGNSNAAI